MWSPRIRWRRAQRG
uniref:Protease Do-like 9 n=1 Tax=Rhizophora mucronata TaxID=61149 RepID=A0A2P2JGZ7_RHIMU